MKRWMVGAGWILSAMGLFILLTSARWKLTRQPFYVAEWGRIGYADSALQGIALLQLACVVLYVIPQRRCWAWCCSPAILAAPSRRMFGSGNPFQC